MEFLFITWLTLAPLLAGSSIQVSYLRLSIKATTPPLHISPIVDPRGCERPSQVSTNESAARMPTNQSGAGKLGCSCRTGSAAPLGEGASPGAASSGWSRRAPWGPHSSAKGSAGFQPNAPPSQCIRLSKDLSGLQKVSQLNFAFCSSFSLPSTAVLRPEQNFVGTFRERSAEVQEGFYH